MSSVQESGGSTSVHSVAPTAVEEPTSKKPDQKQVTEAVTDISSRAVRETPSDKPTASTSNFEEAQWSDEGGNSKRTDGNGHALKNDMRTQTEAPSTPVVTERSVERHSDKSESAPKPPVVVTGGDSSGNGARTDRSGASDESSKPKEGNVKTEAGDNKTKTELKGEPKTSGGKPSDPDHLEEEEPVVAVEEARMEDDLPPKPIPKTALGQVLQDVRPMFDDMKTVSERGFGVPSQESMSSIFASLRETWNSSMNYQPPSFNFPRSTAPAPAPSPSPSPSPAPAPVENLPIEKVEPLPEPQPEPVEDDPIVHVDPLPNPKPSPQPKPGTGVPPEDQVVRGEPITKPAQMSGQDASRIIAHHMGKNGIQSVTMNDLLTMSLDKKSPELAAAANYFINNPKAYQAVETHDVARIDGRSGLSNFQNAAKGKVALPPTPTAPRGNVPEASGAVAKYMADNKLENLSYNDLYRLSTLTTTSKNLSEVNKTRELASAATLLLNRPDQFRKLDTSQGAPADNVIKRTDLQKQAASGDASSAVKPISRA